MLVSNRQVEPSAFKLPVEDRVVVKIPVFPNLTVKTGYVRTRLSQSFLFHFLLYLCKQIISALFPNARNY